MCQSTRTNTKNNVQYERERKLQMKKRRIQKVNIKAAATITVARVR